MFTAADFQREVMGQGCKPDLPNTNPWAKETIARQDGYVEAGKTPPVVPPALAKAAANFRACASLLGVPSLLANNLILDVTKPLIAQYAETIAARDLLAQQVAVNTGLRHEAGTDRVRRSEAETSLAAARNEIASLKRYIKEIEKDRADQTAAIDRLEAQAGDRRGLDDVIAGQRRAIASKQIEIDYLKAGVTAALNAKPAPTSDELKVGDKVDVLDTNGIWNAGNRFVTKVDCGRVDTELQSSAGQGFPWSWERSQVRKAKEA